jgi:hypothetical protein
MRGQWRHWRTGRVGFGDVAEAKLARVAVRTKMRSPPAPAQAALLVKSMPRDAPVVGYLDARRASAVRLSGSIAAWAEPTRPMHGLSQRCVNRINGCIDCRPQLRPPVPVPAALHGYPVSDPGKGCRVVQPCGRPVSQITALAEEY